MKHDDWRLGRVIGLFSRSPTDPTIVAVGESIAVVHGARGEEGESPLTSSGRSVGRSAARMKNGG